jgi:hypothetical protein
LSILIAGSGQAVVHPILPGAFDFAQKFGRNSFRGFSSDREALQQARNFIAPVKMIGPSRIDHKR